MIAYRILRIENGYYPQLQERYFFGLIRGRWLRIARHPGGGFGLYGEGGTDNYPISREEAEKVIRDYRMNLEAMKDREVVWRSGTK